MRLGGMHTRSKRGQDTVIARLRCSRSLHCGTSDVEGYASLKTRAGVSRLAGFAVEAYEAGAIKETCRACCKRMAWTHPMYGEAATTSQPSRLGGEDTFETAFNTWKDAGKY